MSTSKTSLRVLLSSVMVISSLATESTLTMAQADGLAVDAAGNASVTGRTNSTNSPTTPGVLQPTLGGDYDTFIAKLTSTGTTPEVRKPTLGGDYDTFIARIYK